MVEGNIYFGEKTFQLNASHVESIVARTTVASVLMRSFIAWGMLCQPCVYVWVCATCAKRTTYWWHCKPVVARLVTCNMSPAVYTIRVICCWVLTRQFPVRFGRGVSSQSAIHTYAWLHRCWMLVLVFTSTAEPASSVSARSSCHHCSTCSSDMPGWSRSRMRCIILRCIYTKNMMLILSPCLFSR